MSTKYIYLQDLVTAMEKNAELKNQVVKDPAEALKNLQGSIPNTRVYQIVIAVLGLAIMTAMIGALILVGLGKPQEAIPQAVITMGSTAIGALVGLLTPAPNQDARRS